jgi:hypothetical protein
MENEPFIMKTVERAREWVDAYALSTKSDKEESASILAMLCGFGSWEVMVFAIESMPPTACDEAMPEDVVVQRKEGYMHVFVCLLNVRPAIAMFFIKRLSPSADFPFKSFEMKEALAEEEKIEDELDEDLELESIPDPTRLFTSARLCGQINIQGWCTGLDLLGWDIEVDTVDPDADIGEPSFVVNDVTLGPVPVYLGGFTRVPGTDDDPAGNLLMKACLGDFMMEYTSEDDPRVFLILWQSPQHKRIGKRDYCCIGVRYSLDDRTWKDVLVSGQCDSLARLFELNDSFSHIEEIELCAVNADLADEGCSVGNLLAVLLAGLPALDESAEDGWIIERREDDESGWGLLRALDPAELATPE